MNNKIKELLDLAERHDLTQYLKYIDLFNDRHLPVDRKTYRRVIREEDRYVLHIDDHNPQGIIGALSIFPEIECYKILRDDIFNT